MLPTADDAGPRLADVLASGLASVRGEANRLRLPRSRKALVVLVDGLGASALAARSGHARHLAGALGPRTIIRSGFPTTTASAITSLTTGASAGTHGIVGYSVLDPERDEVVNQLSGFTGDAVAWQPVPTLFERAVADGLDAVAIGPERYHDSGFTRIALRGARYLDARTIDDRFGVALDWLAAPGEGIGYLYVPELDSAAHAFGWQSDEWTRRLEALDGVVAALGALPKGTGALLTADHGVLDVPSTSHVQWDADPGLSEGVRHVAGDPRCVHLHVEGDAASAALAAWHASEDSRSWVASRDEAIDAGWFGEVTDAMRPRIGDVVVAARKGIAYWSASRSGADGMTLIGQHGSFAPEELRVPLLPFGVFAR